MGEAGRSLFELLTESGRFIVHRYDLDEAKMVGLDNTRKASPRKVDALHVCILCANQEMLVNTAAKYAGQFTPKLVIMNSTVVPGTTKEVPKRCECLVAHLPRAK